MLSRRGRNRRAPARFQEATTNTRSRRSATVTARSDDHNGDDDSPPAITSDANVTVLQQHMQCMQQQMQSMHDIVSTLASMSSAPAAATAFPSTSNTPAGASALPSTSNTPAGASALPSTSNTPAGASALPSTSNTPAGASALPSTSNTPAGASALPSTSNTLAGATAFPSTSNTPAGATAYPPPLPDDGVHPGEIARASNMSSFSSVPLGSVVDSKLKARIWGGHYIELDLLLGRVVDNPVLIFDIRLQQSSVQTREQAQHRITNISQWTDAFLVFMAIYTERFPTEVASVLKYVQLMRTMAFTTKSNIFLAYDRDFRKLRAHNNMPWNVLHHELFFLLTSRAHHAPSVQQKMGFPQRKQPFRAGLCYAFVSTGRCRKPLCPYKHACPSCGGNHPKSHCQTKQMLHPVTKPTNAGYRK